MAFKKQLRQLMDKTLTWAYPLPSAGPQCIGRRVATANIENSLNTDIAGLISKICTYQILHCQA